MVHHDVDLNDDFQYGSGFGAGFETIVQSGKTGHEVRIQTSDQARHRFILQKELQSSQEAASLKAFALGRRGSKASFNLKDWSDYTSNGVDGITPPTAFDQLLGTGDGLEDTYSIIKTYDQSGPQPYIRRIKKIVTGTLVVAVNGFVVSAYTVNGVGQITFTTPPPLGHQITAGYEFKVIGRFESTYEQWQRLQADSFDNWSMKDIAIIETRDEDEWPELFWPGGGRSWGDVAGNITLSFQDGVLQKIKPTAAISCIFPQPELAASGPELFTVWVDPTASGSVQMRDDTGAAIGTAMTAGQVRRFGFVRTLDGSAYYWTQT